MSLQIQQGRVSIVFLHLPGEVAGRLPKNGFLSLRADQTGCWVKNGFDLTTVLKQN